MKKMFRCALLALSWLVPFGRSVDQYGVVQLDSRNGIGGVAPNPRVPKTLENVLACAAGTDVELQYAVKYLGGY